MNELHYQLDLLKAMNQKLTEKERMYRTVCGSTVGAILYQSFEQNRVETLGQWEDFFDFDIREPKEIFKLADTVEEKYSMELRDVLFLEKTGQEARSLECVKKNSKIWLQFRMKVCYDESGRPIDKVLYITDITKFQIQNDELKYMAYYDSVTGLYNRNYFVRILAEYVKHPASSDGILSVMMIDIDDFHKINDTHGLVIGEELIQQFGCILKDLCEEYSIVGCHMHTDVYCVAVSFPSKDRTVESVYQELKKRTKSPFRMSNGQEFQITFCAGVAEYSEASSTPMDLISYAEIMVYKSKTQGRGHIQYFNTHVLEEFFHSTELENRLKEAVFNYNFEVYFQMQYYTGSKKLRGMEALIRWKDGDDHMISPAIFIPIAEKNGTIIPIGKWVVEQSVQQYALWRKRYGYPFVMSINISALQYNRDDFVDSIIGVIEKYQVPFSEIELEITETILIDDFQTVYEKLKILRDYGIRISLDDFGTGFSALSYLKKLPINTLKIDKSFIDTVLSDAATRVITESIVEMVKKLGFESIAEGVENEEQYEYLQSIGCDVIQGYLFSRPLPVAELEPILESLLG